MTTDIADIDHVIYNLPFTHVYSLNKQLPQEDPAGAKILYSLGRQGSLIHSVSLITFLYKINLLTNYKLVYLILLY